MTWAIVAIGAPQLARAAAVQNQGPPLTREQMLEDLSMLGAEVESAWAYVDDKKELFGVDVPKLVKSTGERLPERATLREFQTQVQRFAASLFDGHASVVSPLVGTPRQPWPIDLIDGAEGVLVRRVHASAKGHVAVADRVVAVDGVPVEERLAEIAEITVASSPQGRRHSSLEALRWQAGPTLRLTLENAAGALREVELECAEREWRHDELRLERLENEVAYLRLPTFTIDNWQDWLSEGGHVDRDLDDWIGAAKSQIDELFSKMSDAPALILDVRGNGGGTDWLGMHLARHLLEPGFAYFTLRTRYSAVWVDAVAATGVERSKIPSTGWSELYSERPKNEPPIEPWKGPLWILVDAGCFSTCDNAKARPNATRCC